MRNTSGPGVATIAIAVGTAAAAIGILAIIGTLARAELAVGAEAPATFAWCATLAAVLLQAGALLGARHHAAPTLGVVAAVPIALALVAPSELFSVTAFPVLVAAFLAGLRTPVRPLRWWALAAAVAVAAGQAANGAGGPHGDAAGLLAGALLQAVIVVGAPLLPALALAASRAARRAQRELVAALTRERDAQIGEAIAVERAAMARELHDIAAHHLSGISLMASAVSRQVETAPDAARSGALQIREQANLILDDLRRLVGMLRDSSPDEAVKTIDTIPALVEGAAATGAAVRLRVLRGDRELAAGIGPLAQLAAYRMVQESLTNARRYAPGAECIVTIDDTRPALLRIIVRNAPPSPGSAVPASGSGFGILGMRERAALIGASFAAGPTGDDGWETIMSIPRETLHSTPGATT